MYLVRVCVRTCACVRVHACTCAHKFKEKLKRLVGRTFKHKVILYFSHKNKILNRICLAESIMVCGCLQESEFLLSFLCLFGCHGSQCVEILNILPTRS